WPRFQRPASAGHNYMLDVRRKSFGNGRAVLRENAFPSADECGIFRKSTQYATPRTSDPTNARCSAFLVDARGCTQRLKRAVFHEYIPPTVRTRIYQWTRGSAGGP